MPFLTAKLPKEMIALLAFWIGVGAPLADAGTSEKPKSAPAGLDQEPTNSDFPTAKQMPEKSPSSGADRKHWAFQPPQQLEIPQVKDPGWVRNPIDAFIASDHDRLDLEPIPRAKKRVLLRRVYLDLIGLPPTPAQLRSFLEDLSPNAYDKVVMDLLSSPQSGERWGRHWMDVWRYSNWYGYKTEVRYSQRHIWRWRDWIVESLNQDKGYDRMIVEILAGPSLSCGFDHGKGTRHAIRLGATIDDYLSTCDPDALVAECRKKGYRAAAMPLAALDQPAIVRDIASALDQSDILLAEMAAWVNPLHHKPEQRGQNIASIKKILTLADELGATCCPTVVGSYCETDQWDSHVGHHPDNFSERAFDEVVDWVREVLDQVRPTRSIDVSQIHSVST